MKVCKYCKKDFKPKDSRTVHCSRRCSKMGHTFTKEVKAQMSKKRKGVAQSEEHKNKIRDGQLKRVAEGRHNNYKNGVSKDPVWVSFRKNQWHHRNRTATGSHTFEEWGLLKAQYNWTCPCC